MYTYAIKKHNVSDLHTISKAIMHSPPPAVLESHACQFPCGFRTVAPWRRPAVVVTSNRQMPMRGAMVKTHTFYHAPLQFSYGSPMEAVCSRGDLKPADADAWGTDDPLVVARGCFDGKVTNYRCTA